MPVFTVVFYYRGRLPFLVCVILKICVYLLYLPVYNVVGFLTKLWLLLNILLREVYSHLPPNTFDNISGAVVYLSGFRKCLEFCNYSGHVADTDLISSAPESQKPTCSVLY